MCGSIDDCTMSMVHSESRLPSRENVDTSSTTPFRCLHFTTAMRGSSIGRALRRPRLSFTRQPSLARRIPHCRRYSTASSAGAKSSADAAWAGALAPFVDELDRIAPSFAMQGDRIRLLETPAEFYQTLKVRGAKNIRVVGHAVTKVVGCR